MDGDADKEAEDTARQRRRSLIDRHEVRREERDRGAARKREEKRLEAKRAAAQDGGEREEEVGPELDRDAPGGEIPCAGVVEAQNLQEDEIGEQALKGKLRREDFLRMAERERRHLRQK